MGFSKEDDHHQEPMKASPILAAEKRGRTSVMEIPYIP